MVEVMKGVLGQGAVPKKTDTVIRVSSGVTWKYEASGLDCLWIEGGITFSGDGYSVMFHDIQGIHDKIADHIVSQKKLSGPAFRFLRKELSLTASAAAAALLFRDEAEGSDKVEKWEKGGGFSIPEADGIIGLYK